MGPFQRFPKLVLSLCLFAPLACADSTTRTSGWLEVADSAGWLTVIENPSLCHECIELEEVVVLGEEEGPGFIEETRVATIDSVGNYWIGGREGPKVYAPNGTFLRRVGNAGQGPLEFGSEGILYTDHDGYVHVLDGANARETIIAPDFTVYREHRLPGWVYEAVPLPGDDRKLVNIDLQTSERLGLPLHIMEGSDIVASFGSQQAGSYYLNPLRRITVDRQGTIYSGKKFEYEVEIWSNTGRRIAGIRRPALWEPPPDGQPCPLSPTRSGKS